MRRASRSNFAPWASAGCAAAARASRKPRVLFIFPRVKEPFSVVSERRERRRDSLVHPRYGTVCPSVHAECWSAVMFQRHRCMVPPAKRCSTASCSSVRP